MKTAPIARQTALAAALLAATCAAQAAIVISLTPFQQADTTWATQVNVSGSVAANAALTRLQTNMQPFSGGWSALVMPYGTNGTSGDFGLLHARSAPANVNYDSYAISTGWSFVNNLGVPDFSRREIAGAPGGAFGAFTRVSADSGTLFLNTGYVLGNTVSYDYTAANDIRNWAVDGAYASLKDANGLELLRIQVGAATVPTTTAGSEVPEPTSLALAGLALAGLGFMRRRQA